MRSRTPRSPSRPGCRSPSAARGVVHGRVEPSEPVIDPCQQVVQRVLIADVDRHGLARRRSFWPQPAGTGHLCRVRPTRCAPMPRLAPGTSAIFPDIRWVRSASVKALLLCFVRLSWPFSGSKGLRPGGLELRLVEVNDSCCKGRTVINNNVPVNNGQDHRSLGELVRRCCQWIVPYHREVGAGPFLNDSAFFTN
jgi:hypothetical protein